MLTQVAWKMHGITRKIVFSVGWIRFVVKQRTVEYVTTTLGGGTMQLMMLFKRNEKNGRSGNWKEASKNIN